MAKKKEDGDFFVGIEDSTDIRRDVLESTKRVVEIMQKYERFKEIRAKKMKQIESLKKILFDISKLNTRLKSALPKTRVRVPHSIETKKKGKDEKVIRPVEESKHIEGLDKDLKEIEDKLSMLER